jgi:hypothetical protein
MVRATRAPHELNKLIDSIRGRWSKTQLQRRQRVAEARQCRLADLLLQPAAAAVYASRVSN